MKASRSLPSYRRTHKKQTAHSNTGRVFLACVLILALLVMDGCASLLVKERRFPEFVAVMAGKDDSFSSLASKYLNDPSKGWVIAEFNECQTIAPGQELIIPLTIQPKETVTPQGYQTVPILAYHNFSRNRRGKSTVAQHDFEAQMKYLNDNGYHVISLDEFFDFLDYKTPIPKKSVVITIDDGWRGTYTIAYPILKKYGYPATLFLYTDLITGSEKTLSWKQVRELAKNGMDIQNHTKTHRNLTEENPDTPFRDYFETLVKELSDSERKINRKLGVEVKYFAYPYSETTPLVIALLKKRGYRGAFTVERGTNPFFINRYRVHRSVIYGDMDLNTFKENLLIVHRGAGQ